MTNTVTSLFHFPPPPFSCGWDPEGSGCRVQLLLPGASDLLLTHSLKEAFFSFDPDSLEKWSFC